MIVLYWVLPSRCGGSLANNYFSFRPVNNADVLVELLAIFGECGVMPMLHVPGIARYVIDRGLRPRLITSLEGGLDIVGTNPTLNPPELITEVLTCSIPTLNVPYTVKTLLALNN